MTNRRDISMPFIWKLFEISLSHEYRTTSTPETRGHFDEWAEVSIQMFFTNVIQDWERIASVEEKTQQLYFGMGTPSVMATAEQSVTGAAILESVHGLSLLQSMSTALGREDTR